MTPEQEATLNLVYGRAGEHPRRAHIDVTGINRHLLVSLILAGYLRINADNTVTLTGIGIAAVVRLRRGFTGVDRPAVVQSRRRRRGWQGGVFGAYKGNSERFGALEN